MSAKAMQQNNVGETLIGAAVVAVAVLFVVFGYYRTGTGSLSGYELNAKLAKVDGLGIGTDVRLAGIKIGSVTELVRTLREEGVRGKRGRLLDKGYVYQLFRNLAERGVTIVLLSSEVEELTDTQLDAQIVVDGSGRRWRGTVHTVFIAFCSARPTPRPP